MTARASIALGALLVCAGCATAPGTPPPAVQARVAEANSRGAALVRAGDDAGAARQYEEALRLARSVEDADAMAAAAVNLSIVYQWLGRDPAAREILAVVLDDKHLAFPERRRAQAELRRAILDLAARDTAGAATWAERARTRCERAPCDFRAAILNVQAQIALDSGRADEAERLAQEAARAAGAPGDRAETANAQRTVGRARSALGNPAGAIPALEQALALDRELADPRRILVDLVELAQANLAAGNRDAGRAYLERALVVARSARNERGAADVEARLRALGAR